MFITSGCREEGVRPTTIRPSFRGTRLWFPQTLKIGAHARKLVFNEYGLKQAKIWYSLIRVRVNQSTWLLFKFEWHNLSGSRQGFWTQYFLIYFFNRSTGGCSKSCAFFRILTSWGPPVSAATASSYCRELLLKLLPTKIIFLRTDLINVAPTPPPECSGELCILKIGFPYPEFRFQTRFGVLHTRYEKKQTSFECEKISIFDAKFRKFS